MTSAYRGRHEVARRSARLPVPSRRPRPRRWPAPLVILASAGLACAGALLAEGRSTTIPDDGVDRAAAIQVDAWEATGASPSALMVVAAVVTVVFTGALARRFGLSLPAITVAVVVPASLPWAVAGHLLVAPVNLAVPWLLAAAVLMSASGRRRWGAVPALVVAVLTAPIVVPVAVLTVAVLLADRDLGTGWTGTNRAAGVAVLGVLGAGVFVIVAGLGGDGFGLRQATPDVTPVAVDLAVGAVVLIGAAAGTIVRWLRPFALVVLGCAAVAAVAASTRTALLLLALPAAAIVLGAAIDAAASADRLRRHARPTPLRTAAAVVLTLLAGVALVAIGPRA